MEPGKGFYSLSAILNERAVIESRRVYNRVYNRVISSRSREICNKTMQIPSLRASPSGRNDNKRYYSGYAL